MLKSLIAVSLTLTLSCCVVASVVAQAVQNAPQPSQGAKALTPEDLRELGKSLVLGAPYFYTKGSQGATSSLSLPTATPRGEALMKAGDNDGAISAFQQTLVTHPHDGLALQRLAEAYTAEGQTDKALATYRALLYPLPHQRWTNSNVNSPTVLMHFALLLLQKGQAQEALTTYHRAVYFLDYDGGRLNASVPVPVPDIGDGPSQLPYTPQTLEAMAHAAIGIETPGFDVPELQKAAALAPDSAVVQYYLGRSLLVRDPRASRPAFERAIQLGDDRMAQEANHYLRMAR